MSIPAGSILVIEDVANVRDLIEIALKFKGYPVITATNGEDALEKIKEQKPALIISDILMPKMDGYTLAQKLRTDPDTRQVPIIFVSATYITPDDKDFAYSLGVARFIEKPIDTEDFLLTVAEVLIQDGPVLPAAPLDEKDFKSGYRQRLENKLRYKNTQISRIERLLLSLGEEQRPPFEELLKQAIVDRDQIQRDLDNLFRSQR
jgi:CheY-like chemotaxis protein